MTPYIYFVYYMKNFLALFLILLLSVLFLDNCAPKADLSTTSWSVTGGGKQGGHYTGARQIDTNNVINLQVAWTYHTGDADTAHHSQIQCNPIIAHDVMYVTSPQLKVAALDVATGKEIWSYDPQANREFDRGANFALNNNRGVSYWEKGDERRIFFVAGALLRALDARTGKPVAAFGNNGTIDLHDGLGRDVAGLYVTSTSPGIIYKDLIIMGTRVSEQSDAAPGHLRAYDVRTGKMRWIFHTIPQPGEFGYDTWEDPVAYQHIGGANCWSGFTLDEKRGILFAPIGSASFDFYGGMRKGNGLFANCLLALDAATGKRIWHFQMVHHDVWDKDLPTAPALVTLHRNGQTIDAVAQPTKTGYIYVFERATGKPVFPIEEVPVPLYSEMEGEKLSPTQPIPTLPKAFTRQGFKESDLNTLVSTESFNDIQKKYRKYKTNNLYNPLSAEGTVLFPGLDGGAEWGGPAVDPATDVMYVNANEIPWVLTLHKVGPKNSGGENFASAGKRLYIQHCMACHGANREGAGAFPSLVEAHTKYNAAQTTQLISTGRRMMPGFTQLNEEEKQAIAAFVLNDASVGQKKFTSAIQADTFLNLSYNISGYNKFQTKEGYPAIQPPWGTLNAVNLNTGNIEWRIPLGETEAFKKKGIITGTENYGGPVVTAGGLLFIGATMDGKFRAFNKRTGALLWETTLPAGGFATPAAYTYKGKQYIVIACGGGRGHISGDSYVSFALPDK